MGNFVTICGSNGRPISLQFDSASNFALAAQVAAHINANIASGSFATVYDTAHLVSELPASVKGVHVQTAAPLAFLSAAYPVDVITKHGSAVVFGTDIADQVVLSDAATDLTFLATGGTGTVAAGGGNNQIVVSGNNRSQWVLYTGAGDDFITTLGDLSATISAGGGHNAIGLGGGHYYVASSGTDVISAGSGNVTIDATAAQSDVVQGGSSNLLFLGGAGGATILGGTGSDTYFGSAGPTGAQFVRGGSAGHNLLMAGDGAATLLGGGDGDQLYARGSARQLLRAGGGNETLSAALSWGADTLVAGSGHDQITGGSGNNTIVGGSGAATVNAGTGQTVFEFIKNSAGGTMLVQPFDSPIRIHLEGYGSGAINYALNRQQVSGDSLTVTLGDNTRITFQHVASLLTASNFI